MNKLDEYIKKAMEKQGVKSKRQFCEILGVSSSATTAYNNGSYPNDETMMKIADMAGVNPLTALLDLNIMRSKGAARQQYQRLRENVSKGAQTLGVASILALSTTTANAQIVSAPDHSVAYDNRYIITSIECAKGHTHHAAKDHAHEL